MDLKINMKIGEENEVLFFTFAPALRGSVREGVKRNENRKGDGHP